MSLREFTDERGRPWRVWDVYPTLSERRRKDAGPPPGYRERRRYIEARRLSIHRDMTTGWLVFEAADGERRRLAPVPDASNPWFEASDEQLGAWCSAAVPAPPARRLIE